MSTNCPSCEGTDINFETRTCRACNDSIDAAPQAPREKEEAALLHEVVEATETMEQATTEEEKRRAYENWEEKVFQYDDKGFRIITLIGFSGAGKTFFAHRLRRKLADDWKVMPPHADVIRGTDMTIEWTQLVRKEKRPRRRLLADCDGEAFKEVIEALKKSHDIDSNMRRSMVITALASAYILILPASELIDRNKYKDTNLLTERFGMIVQLIMALQGIVKTVGSAREALHSGLKLDAVAAALEREYNCGQPIHILFAQADKLPKKQTYEDDPHMFALTHAETLYRTIESNFANFRFDFVCAFEGHDPNDTLLTFFAEKMPDLREEARSILEEAGPIKALLHMVADGISKRPEDTQEALKKAFKEALEKAFTVDYNLPSYGTVAAFDWIDEMLEASPRDRHRTATAMKIRRRYDAAFKKLSTRVSG